MGRLMNTPRLGHRLPTLLLILAILLPFGGRVEAQERRDVRINHLTTHTVVKSDGTYVSTLEQELEVLTPFGRRSAGQMELSYHPDSQEIIVLEAAVIQPDGTRTDVPKDSIITRPSAVSQRSPGFSKQMTVTILFPNVHEGSRTVVKAQRRVFVPSPVGINVVAGAPPQTPAEHYQLSFDVPADFPFRTATRGKWDVTDVIEGDRRRITAVLRDDIQLLTEPWTPDQDDYLPLFVASSLPSWEAVGDAYREGAAGKAVPTPEIETLARAIVSGRQGRDAVQAVYDWIVQNIRYVQVYLDPHAGYVPNPASLILERRYGDCKDYVTLMQAMLASIGISSDPVLVSWGSRHGVYPVPTAFQFNHAMIHVPDHGVWANPTDNLAPMGMMDDGLAGKFVVVAAEKPFTARLPMPTADTNFQREVETIVLDADGTVRGTGRITAGGSLDKSIRRKFDSWQTTQEMADDQLRGQPFGGFGDMISTPPRDLSTPMAVSTTWESPAAVRMDDHILFDPPSGLTMMGLTIDGVQVRGERLFPFLVRHGRRVKETEVVLPDGYRPARLPRDVSVANDTGSYTASYRTEGGRVFIRRELVLNSPVHAAEAYDAFMDIAIAVRHDSHQPLHLVRD